MMRHSLFLCNSNAAPTPSRPPADGQSHANVAGKIVSGMEAGCDPANGLTELGLEQARAAGKELKEVLLRAGCSPANTMVRPDWAVFYPPNGTYRSKKIR